MQRLVKDRYSEKHSMACLFVSVPVCLKQSHLCVYLLPLDLHLFLSHPISHLPLRLSMLFCLITPQLVPISCFKSCICHKAFSHLHLSLFTSRHASFICLMFFNLSLIPCGLSSASSFLSLSLPPFLFCLFSRLTISLFSLFVISFSLQPVLASCVVCSS